MLQVIAQQLPPDPAQRFLDRRDLRDDVGAVAILLHHFLQAADLSLDAAQPLHVRVLDRRIDGDGTFSVDTAKIRDGVTALTREIMTLQAEGSYAKARQMIETLGVLRPEAKAILDKLTSVPVDIEPRFVTAIDLLK